MSSSLESELCPACALREVPARSALGLCDPCVVDRTAERYATEDRSASEWRYLGWSERTNGTAAESSRLRQHRHRLITKTRPREPAHSSDPLEIAAEGLTALNLLRSTTVSMSPAAAERIEEASEALRRLAWGPD